MKHNRLQNTTTYLAGGIDRVADGGVSWRRAIIPFLQSMRVVVFDPTNKPMDIAGENIENREYKEQLKRDKNYNELARKMREIRSIDLRLVDKSDFIVCYIDTLTFLCGTMEEIFLANRQKKPVLVVIEGGKDLLPDWLWGTLIPQHIFNNFDELKEYLRHINEDEVIDTCKRWVFW